MKVEFVSEINNVLTVDITISKNSDAASGMYTLVFDPNIFEFKSHKQGEALPGFW